MGKNNPMNPYSRDETKTQRDVPMPISKAKVLSAKSHPDNDGYHTARIRIYGDEAPYDAPVLSISVGSAWIPKKDSDVAVIFGANDKPWVVGPWYAVNRVEDGEVDLPDYEPGEFVLGNESGGYIRLDNDGNIHINSSSDGSVYIDGVEQ